ncbi:MAG: exodeoxyribonuclease VII large subunit, partial [Myxococcales bacterium]|nr:exodeoxyribonuclease VII large subunit [Myxococcales bacterium]
MPTDADKTPTPICSREQPLGVTRLVSMAGRSLDQRFGVVWVAGEVSNLRTPSSGHLYFTLKDARAALPVVMFRSAASKLRFRLEDGLGVRCRGRLSIYEVQGRFQLTADFAEPEGVGAQQIALEKLKAKLAKEGLFDAARKKPLPRLPRRIAVV